MVDLRGEILRRATCDTTGMDGTRTLEALHDLLDRLIAAAARPLVGIGIATPGLIDPEGSIVRRSVHLDWRDLPLGRQLQEPDRVARGRGVEDHSVEEGGHFL